MSKFLTALVGVAMVMMLSCTFALAEDFEDLLLIGAGTPTPQQTGVGSSGTPNASALFGASAISVAVPTPAPAPAMPMPAIDWTAFFSLFMPTAASAASTPSTGISGAMNAGSSGVSYSADYNATKAAIHTPQQAFDYMKNNFSYGFDTRYGGFTSTPPAEVNATKWGSCKEFSTFMADVLEDDGIKVDLVTMRYGADRTDGNVNGHVVAVSTYNGAAYLTYNNEGIWQVSNNADIINISSPRLPGGNARDLKYYPGTFRGELRP